MANSKYDTCRNTGAFRFESASARRWLIQFHRITTTTALNHLDANNPEPSELIQDVLLDSPDNLEETR